MSQPGHAIGLWGGRIPLAEPFGEAAYYLQCSRAIARLAPSARWLLTGRERREDLNALRSMGIPPVRPRLPWPPRRLTKALGVPRLEWEYGNLGLVHYWSSTGAPRTSVPYVLTILDGIALAGRFGERGDVDGTRRLARKAKSIMTLTWEAAELIAEVLGMDKLNLVPVGAGVDTERFSPVKAADDPAVLARHGLDCEYMLYLGGWAPRKGLRPLLKALASIDERDRPVVALAGRPGDADHQLAGDYRRLGARTLGYVPDADVPALLRNARALVLPTLAEGFGLPVIEAQACGLPVVASDLDVIRSVSGGHALLFPPGDAAAMARALLAVRQRGGQVIEGGLVNARRHTWPAVAQRVMSVYASALGMPDPVAAPAA